MDPSLRSTGPTLLILTGCIWAKQPALCSTLFVLSKILVHAGVAECRSSRILHAVRYDWTRCGFPNAHQHLCPHNHSFGVRVDIAARPGQLAGWRLESFETDPLQGLRVRCGEAVGSSVKITAVDAKGNALEHDEQRQAAATAAGQAVRLKLVQGFGLLPQELLQGCRTKLRVGQLQFCVPAGQCSTTNQQQPGLDGTVEHRASELSLGQLEYSEEAHGFVLGETSIVGSIDSSLRHIGRSITMVCETATGSSSPLCAVLLLGKTERMELVVEDAEEGAEGARAMLEGEGEWSEANQLRLAASYTLPGSSAPAWQRATVDWISQLHMPLPSHT